MAWKTHLFTAEFLMRIESLAHPKWNTKQRTFYFPTLAYAPVPENRKVRFSSSYAVLVLVVDHVVAVNVIVVVVTVVVT